MLSQLRREVFVYGGIFLISAAGILTAPTQAQVRQQNAGAAPYPTDEKLLQLADKEIAADPEKPGPYAFRAELYDVRHDFAHAIDDYTKVIALLPDSAVTFQRRGEDYFRTGRFSESVADFDKVILLDPARAPYHWQRGISLYYAGEFDAGAKQFELHKTVNPEDVENAVWHFLCVARSAGVEKARAALIPIRDDGRVPMMQVYALFGGKGTEQQVMDAVAAGQPTDPALRDRLFYAHLYLGLYDEAAGRTDSAREHIRLAAEKYAGDDYMGDVARVHLAAMQVVHIRNIGDFHQPAGTWTNANAVALDATNPARLKITPGKGIFVNSESGPTSDIITNAEFGDCQIHVEFLISKGSNSGVYVMGRYELQIYDSFGKKTDEYPGIECGGIYPRWINDQGVNGHSPLVNASKPPGEWQTFDITFRAPRFDKAGKKIANGVFAKVVHNGQTVQENIEVTGPTRSAAFDDEKPTGPIMLQGDHGPVAFRNISVTPIEPSAQLVAGGGAEMGNGPATAARLDKPFAVAFDNAGNMYIGEYGGQRIRKVDAKGMISTIAGTGVLGFSGDGGPATACTFNCIHDLVVGPDGNLYIADSFNRRVRKLDLQTGVITTFAGDDGGKTAAGDNGPADKATLDGVASLFFDHAGKTLYIAGFSKLVRAVDFKTRIITTVAGLPGGRSIAVDSKDNLYVAGGQTLSVRSPDGKVRVLLDKTHTGGADLPLAANPKHLGIDGHDNVWICDEEHSLLRKYEPATEKFYTIAGVGKEGKAGVGGPLGKLELNRPHGIYFYAPTGEMFLADSMNDRVLKFVP